MILDLEVIRHGGFDFFSVLRKAPGLMKSFLTRIPGPHLEKAARRMVKMAAMARHNGSSSVREGVTKGLSEEGARSQGESRFSLNQNNHSRGR